MPDMAKAEKTGIVNEITQSSPVSGVVKDANGDPLFGVNIVVKALPSVLSRILTGTFHLRLRPDRLWLFLISVLNRRK